MSGQASFSFAPDGNTLAVVDKDSRDKALAVFLLNWQTGESRQLTTPPEQMIDNTPRFSPDGTMIAFLRSFNSSTQKVFIVPARRRRSFLARDAEFDWSGAETEIRRAIELNPNLASA